ncbi:hypothetical protein [Ruminococcus sp.]|uniref:hypothetical protein n=1 Tax=Ruminococcus sp. TaxID=41978 RepID=UPI001B6C7FF5|nr:hypothetical protein [Ruminococcus sp.]MBP5433396.1 hypothetical protein [Ruminococcus sp.]
MFLQDSGIPIGLKFDNTSYKQFYIFRSNQLMEYLMQLFTYHNLPEELPAHEIDTYLYLYGRCGINRSRKDPEKLIAVIPAVSTPTDYFDEFKKYTWATPLQGGQQYVNKNGVLISNTMLHNSLYPLVHCTAAKLAHADTTIICSLVNQRDTVAIKAISQKFADDAEDYKRQKYNGNFAVLVDKGFNSLEISDLRTNNTLNIREIADTQQQILQEFWETIGVNKTTEKRERMVSAETAGDPQLLKLNILNMFNSRMEGIKKVNEIFGTDITVECNVNIENYDIRSEDAAEKEEDENEETD